jgi:hypothetical protein
MRDIPREIAEEYQDFFNFLSQEHNLILTISEMNEVIFEAQKLVKKLSLGVVMQQSEQLFCDKCGYPMFYHKPDDIMYCHGCNNTKPAN